jgi:hypothetical protein
MSMNNVAKEAETPRDTDSVQAEIKMIRDIVCRIGESVGIGTTALWGSAPESAEKIGPTPVPAGFFGEALESLRALRGMANQIEMKASRLRNL